MNFRQPTRNAIHMTTRTLELHDCFFLAASTLHSRSVTLGLTTILISVLRGTHKQGGLGHGATHTDFLDALAQDKCLNATSR